MATNQPESTETSGIEKIAAEEGELDGMGRGNTSEAHTLMVRTVVEEVANLAREELSGFADTDLELTRGTFGDGNVAIILGKLDGKSFYALLSEMRRYCRCRRLSKRKPSDGRRRRL